MFNLYEELMMTELKRFRAYKYALAIGDASARRLVLLDSVYGPDAVQILEGIGIRQGDRVADFECGTGATFPWFVRHVGSSGEVVGLDASAVQLAIARRACIDAGLSNVHFVEADVYASGLPRNSFDVAHCRLLLCHLQKPNDAIQEMADVVYPGGVVACFDLDGLFTMPQTDCYDRLRGLYMEGRRLDGLDNALGSTLPTLLLNAGLVEPEMALIHPVYLRGEKKRLWELTF